MYNIPDPLNFIAVKNLLTKTECENIIKNAGNDWVEGLAVNDPDHSIRKVKVSNSVIDQDLINKIKETIFNANDFFYKFKLTDFVDYDPPCIFKYDSENASHYTWHNDLGPEGMLSRKLSFSIQLTDSKLYTGGQLEFLPSFGASSSEQGSIIVFPSYLTHRVTPMLSGVRHVIVGWIHGHPFQ
jgi:PKHD-type hydroxylase